MHAWQPNTYELGSARSWPVTPLGICLILKFKDAAHGCTDQQQANIIREENLLQMVLWKTVHFALFLVKISINFSPGYMASHQRKKSNS
jgi:hypothetical protein